MKKAFAFFIAIAGVFSAVLPLMAATETVDGITWTYTVSDGKASVGGGSYSSPAVPSTTTGSITIPSMLGGKPVTSIGADAFFGCGGLTSVAIPDSVTSIGEYAFAWCEKLTSVTIPDSVPGIESGAFYYCSGLTSVTIPDSVTSIGTDAFAGCEKLTSVTIPDNVTSIGASAFSDCSGLTSVTIPDSVTNIGDSAFSWCYSLTNVTIGCRVASIGNGAFGSCLELTSVTIPDSVTYIGNGSFRDCCELTNITVGAGNSTYKSVNGLLLSKDGRRLIRGVNGEVVIPDSVTCIGDEAFYGCSGLTSVTIPDSVTNSGDSALSWCGALTNVTMKGDCPTVGTSAYSTVASECVVRLPRGNTTYTVAGGKWQGMKVAYYGPEFTIYKGFLFAVDLHGETEVVIPDGVTGIGDSVFDGCDGLTSVTIPDSVTSIGIYAFYYCSGLTSVTIPDSVTSIGDGAFDGCSGLTSITIPDSVTSIGDSVFYGCGLTSVTIPDSVTSIGDYAFCDCSGLTNVTIPDSVTSIGDYAFCDCGLTSVTIPNSVTSIWYSAFHRCSGLTNITVDAGNSAYKSLNGLLLIRDDRMLIQGVNGEVAIPGGVTSIGGGAFDGCSGLTSITIPDSVTSIGYQAFIGCSGLTSITIPCSVTNIGEMAFFGCSGITNVRVPDSVTSIGVGVFDGCSRLTSVTIGSGVTSIGRSAFGLCSGLTSITIPDSVTSIEDSAFDGCSGLTNITFAGNAPSVGNGAFSGVASDCRVYVRRDSTGWGVEIPGTWNGMAIDYLPGNVALGFEEYAQGTELTEEGCPLVTIADDESTTLRIEPLGGSMGNIDMFTPPFTSAGTNCLQVKTTFGKSCAFALKEDKSSVVISPEKPYYVDFLARFTSLDDAPNGVAPYVAQSTGRGMLESGMHVLPRPGFVCYIDDDFMLWRQEVYDIHDLPIATNWWVRAGNGSGGTADYMLTAMGNDSFPEGDDDWYRVTFKAFRDEVSGKLFFNIYLNGEQVRAGDITDFPSMMERPSVATVRFEGIGYVDNIVSYETLPVCIRKVRAKQRWPWNGKVDVSYGVVGDMAARLPEGAYAQLVVTATNRADGAIYVAAAEALSGDTGTAEGLHNVVWDLNAQGLEIVSDDVVFMVRYEEKPYLYCVVDLSAGATAASYPVSYLVDIPSGGWSDDYKTSKLVLRRIEPGTYLMGGSVETTITKSFYIGVFEVTQKQYELVTGAKPSYFNNASYYMTRPVEQVSYDMIRGSSNGAGWPSSSAVDADSFLGKIQSRTGLSLDLPTEAQWEYACRAGTTSAYNNGGDGEDDLEMLGRYLGNGGSGYSQTCDTNNGTAKVGSYWPNAWGLYDMHGNVYELCLDWYGAVEGGVDPKGGVSGAYRVDRGGSWNYDASSCASSCRSYNTSSVKGYNSGFRLCCSAGFGEIIAMADSAVTFVDLRADGIAVLEAKDFEPIRYSSLWAADANATATVTLNGAPFASGKGEGVAAWTPTAAGMYTFQHTTEGSGETLTATFNVAAKDISLAQVVVDCRDVTYSGTAFAPPIQSVICGERTLVEGSDFTLAYSRNVDAGTATIMLTGINLYDGTYTTNFTIRPKPLTEWMVEAIGNHPYTGKAQTPKPTVTDAERGTTLREGVEYTLSYANNTAIGEGIVTVTGKGNYTGSVAMAFVIEPSAGSELEERLGGAGKAESDGKGGWVVTITNDVAAANLPIEIPDDFGNVTIDLNGHDLVGGDGEPVVRIVPGHDEGGPTQLTIVTSDGDAFVQGGEGAPAVEVVDGAQEGVTINIGAGVTVQGGGVPAIDGTIGENNGTLVKVEVPVPTIASKEYTGGQLKADITATEFYAVQNDGGVNAGNYPVMLTLTDVANYRWKDGDSEPIELTFTITKRSVTVAVVGHTATYVYDSTEKSIAGYDATTEDSLYDIAADTAFRGGIIDAALPSVARTDVGVTMMRLTVADFANNNANFDVTYVVTDGWIKITSTKELDELVESFGGLPVSIAPDSEDGWKVTITNDIDAADLPIEIPDNIGSVTIDLNGYDLVGDDGHDGACPSQAIVIVNGEGDGEPTEIAIVNSGEDATVVGGEGAPAIEVAEDAQGGVLINIGEGVSVQGGDDYTPAIIGEVGTNEGTIVKPSRVHIPGEGTVTTPKSWNVGQKVTWKAKAAKGSVFAHWEGEFVDSLGLSRNELRNPSLAFTVPKGFDASQITAVFIALDDDGLSKLSFVDGEGEPMGDEGVIFFELKADVGEFWLVDDSESYVTATVSGLPSGLKFDKKTLRITGAPTKSGVYWVQIKAKNASGYQWAEKVKMVVPGYTTEPKEPKQTQTAYYPLTVISSDTKAGTTSGTGVYADGKKVSISAKPAKNYVFAGWYRDAALTDPMQFASGDYRKASQSVVVPEVRYLFARFVEATTAADPVTGLAAVGSGLTVESKFSWRVGVAVPEDDGVEYESASLPSASAAKLPPGVKFDAAKGRFTGVPTKAGSYPATVTVKNASKATAMVTLTIEVAALDEWAQGTFNGATLLGGGFIETALPSGLVTFTVDAKGKISGKILEGGKTWSLSAPSFSRVGPLENLESLEQLESLENLEPSLAYYATVIAKSGKEVATNEIAIVAEETGAAAVSSKPPYRGFATGTLNPIPHTPDPKPYLSAWQNLWKVEPWKTEMKDYAKANPTRTEEVEGGTITLKLAASGVVTAKGDFVVGYDAAKQKNIVYSSSCSTVVISAEGGYMVYIYFPANEKKKFGGYSGVIWLK